ncbi:MAG: HAD family hydrolase [Candidatus Eisenbacteria bacterium]|nr:HAD family hydrolase [Candidatus Eisenbacteria bacterium]
MNKRALLVFDLDGTLFRGDGATAAAVWETLDRIGLARPSAREICSYFGRPIHEFHAWLRSLAPERNIEEALVEIERREVELVPSKGALFLDVPEVLDRFAREGFRMAICSNGRNPYVRTVLESMGIARFFGAVRYREIEGENKTLMMRDLLAREAVRPVVGIGDRRDDVEAARANGARSVGCAYGFGSREEIEGAEVIVGRAAEIPDAVQRVLAGEADV